MLYPIFKREVYLRRGAMMRISRTGSITLLLLLSLVLVLPHPPIGVPAKALLIAGVLLFTATLVYQLAIQFRRHGEAKRQLIEIERSLGFFDDAQGGAVYPEAWKGPSPNRIIPLLAGGLIVLSAISCIAILIA
jgi:hypothetical protein